MVQRERYTKRAQDGTRHPGHLVYGIDYLKDNSDYEKLDLGECLKVDTSSGIDQAMVDFIARSVRQKLEETSDKTRKEV